MKWASFFITRSHSTTLGTSFLTFVPKQRENLVSIGKKLSGLAMPALQYELNPKGTFLSQPLPTGFLLQKIGPGKCFGGKLGPRILFQWQIGPQQIGPRQIGNEGADKWPFRTSPKIHPFWKLQASVTSKNHIQKHLFSTKGLNARKCI